MRTPAGNECPYFYGDYYRGKNVEECRLIDKQAPPNHWTPDLCASCPVPSIRISNACEYMQLKLQIKRRLGFLKRYVTCSAYCTRSHSEVKEPRVGCGLCHPLEFTVKN